MAIQQEKREVLDEKLIVDGSLSIWMGCLVYDSTLFEKFIAFDEFNKNIMNPSDFIMTGILYCPIEKMRQSFRNILSVVTSRLDTESPEAVHFLLNLLS